MISRSIITNAKFTYSSKAKNFKGGLKYLQYRDQANKHLPQIDPDGNKIQRWVDLGLGSDHSEILDKLDKLQTTDALDSRKNLLARTIVLSPAVSFMQAIPDEQKIEIMEELTEATMSKWFDKMDMPRPEYSYVTHIAETADKRPDGIEKDAEGNQPFLHSHVVLAPTVLGETDGRASYWVYDKDLNKLHEAGREAVEQIWTRELGPEKVEELNRELEEMTRLHQQLDKERELPREQEPDLEAVFKELNNNPNLQRLQQRNLELLSKTQEAPEFNLGGIKQEEITLNEELPHIEHSEKAQTIIETDSRDWDKLLEEYHSIEVDSQQASPELADDTAHPLYTESKETISDINPILENQESIDELRLENQNIEESLDAYEELSQVLKEHEQAAEQGRDERLEELIEDYRDIYDLEAAQVLDAPEEDELERMLAEYEQDLSDVPSQSTRNILEDHDLAYLLEEIEDEQTPRLPDEQDIEEYLNSLDNSRQIDNQQDLSDDYPDL
jgi:hypothetical protein